MILKKRQVQLKCRFKLYYYTMGTGIDNHDEGMNEGMNQKKKREKRETRETLICDTCLSEDLRKKIFKLIGEDGNNKILKSILGIEDAENNHETSD